MIYGKMIYRKMIYRKMMEQDSIHQGTRSLIRKIYRKNGGTRFHTSWARNEIPP